METTNPDIVVKMRFFQHGSVANNGSSFKGRVTHNSIFGSDESFFNYTGREYATEGSIVEDEDRNIDEITNNIEGSFADYTSRSIATKDSINDGKYFTMSSAGRLYTEEQRDRFRRSNEDSFNKDGNLIWEFVVSFPNKETLNEYGHVDQNDLSKTAHVALSKSLKSLGFEMNNVYWWQDYHTNKEHPHLHITFGEKVQQRTRGKFTNKEMQKVMNTFISEFTAKQRFLLDNGITHSDVQKKVNEQRKEIVSLSKDFSYNTLEKIANLYSQLPKSGRLQYNSTFMIPYREQLDEIVEDILNTPEIKEKYDLFIKDASSLDETYVELNHQEVGKFVEQQDHKLRIQIANNVLRNAKEYRQSVANWKENNGKLLLSNKLNKLLENESNEVLSDFNDAIKAGKNAKAFALLNRIPEDTANDLFIKGSFLTVHGRNEFERNTGKLKIYSSSQSGNKGAEHYQNFNKRSIGFNRKTLGVFSNSLAPKLRSETTSAISKQEQEVEDELEKFIREQQNSQYVG